MSNTKNQKSISSVRFFMIITTSTCTNCLHLGAKFQCTVHDMKVDFNNTCDKHELASRLSVSSSCSNCSAVNTSNCAHPGQAAQDLLCVDWKR